MHHTMLDIIDSRVSHSAYFSIGALVFLLVLTFLSFTGYLIYIHWKYSHIPQPKRPSFYMGHLMDIIRYQKESGNDEISITAMLQRWYESVGSPTYVVFFFHKASVVTCDPESVKAIIMHPEHGKDPSFLKNFAYLMGERFMGNGLLTIPDYDTWKPRRQIYDPAFKKSYLKMLLEPFNEIANQFIDNLDPLADGKTDVPMKTKFGEFTLEVISKVAFGSDFTEGIEDQHNSLKQPRLRGSGDLAYLVDLSFRGLEMALRYPAYRYLHPFKAAKYQGTSRAIRAIGRECIRKRIQLIERGEQAPNDILTHILQGASTRESVDIEELVDDFATFYIAGQETTSNLLTFSLVLTLQNPNVLERVQAEVDETLGNKNHVSAEDLEKLEYMEQVFKEALRLYGPVPATVKKAGPNGITLNDYKIPAGTSLTLSSILTCRMPEYFDDPDTFNPGRFDPENKKPSSFVYWPFGLGHRSCIGKHFALMEAKIAFSRLLQKYKVTLPENYKLVAVQRGTNQTEDNVHCTLERRYKENF